MKPEPIATEQIGPEQKSVTLRILERQRATGTSWKRDFIEMSLVRRRRQPRRKLWHRRTAARESNAGTADWVLAGHARTTAMCLRTEYIPNISLRALIVGAAVLA